MSIGVDRLVFAMSQLDQVELDNNEPVIICILDNKFLPKFYGVLKSLRDNDINSELYLDSSKNLKKQHTYADKRNSPVAVKNIRNVSFVFFMSSILFQFICRKLFCYMIACNVIINHFCYVLGMIANSF